MILHLTKSNGTEVHIPASSMSFWYDVKESAGLDLVSQRVVIHLIGGTELVVQGISADQIDALWQKSQPTERLSK